MKLYHYVHCPYCIRVRMAFGFLEKKFESIVLPYNDEKTPTDLCRIKMLPIVQDKEEAMNESLDIIKKYNDGRLEIPSDEKLEKLDHMVSDLGKDIHSLAMPYIIWTQEFDEDSRRYFQTKKEKKRGPFNELMQNQNIFLKNLAPKFDKLESNLEPFFKSADFGIKDILIASHLWALFLVPEFQFSPKVYNYLMEVKRLTLFDYHEDYKAS